MAKEQYGTPERENVIKSLWPSSMPTEEIRAELNKLPGPQFKTNKSLGDFARRLGLTRINPKGGGLGKGQYGSPQREKVLRYLWPSPMPTSEIRAELNKLPGKQFETRKSLSEYARRLGLKRPNPEGIRKRVKEPKPTAAVIVLKPPSPPPKPSSKPFSMSFMQGPDPRQDAWLQQITKNRFSLSEESHAPLDVTYRCRNVKGV